MFISGKPSILIVDDDAGILRVFTKIFEKKGYNVTVAEKGKEAVERLNASHYDIALVDLALPDMAGNDLFPLIENASPNALKIMLTGQTFLQGSVEGADFFVGKPVNPEKLLSIIDTELKNKNSET